MFLNQGRSCPSFRDLRLTSSPHPNLLLPPHISSYFRAVPPFLFLLTPPLPLTLPQPVPPPYASTSHRFSSPPEVPSPIMHPSLSNPKSHAVKHFQRVPPKVVVRFSCMPACHSPYPSFSEQHQAALQHKFHLSLCSTSPFPYDLRCRAYATLAMATHGMKQQYVLLAPLSSTHRSWPVRLSLAECSQLVQARGSYPPPPSPCVLWC